MDQLQKKTLEVSRGFTYTYYTSPAKGKLPTLFMCHGFPDAPDTFEDVVRDFLVPGGYGVIAIDCLGYNGTSKPTETAAYNFQHMSQDLKEIVDREGLDKVIILGHDWGSAVAQRFYNFHADRTCGMVLLNVAYLAPTPDRPFSLDGAIELTESLFGYGLYWYWKLFTAPDGPQILDAHASAMWEAAHGTPESWLETWCKKDGMRAFIESGATQTTMPYATEERKQKWLRSMREGGFDAPLNYYRATAFGEQDKAIAAIPKANIPIKVPLLFWAAKRDYVCRPELLQPSIDAGLIPDSKTVSVDSGHWAHLDKPQEFGEALVAWLKEKF